MKIALVHDYIREYGGAERVLEALCELYPDAPIYTAFVNKDGNAYPHFKNRTLITSWAAKIPGFTTRLHSPLRFLAPSIWNSFDFSEYDVVITSASWYITKGIVSQKLKAKDKRPIEICYCHTPPRWLYGYKTSVEWQKYPPVKLYAKVIGDFMRKYDKEAASRVDFFLANSEETKERIKKFYDRTATVIYPPVSLPELRIKSKELRKKDYYFMVARITGAKGLDIAVKAAIAYGFQLKIAGSPGGYYSDYKKLQTLGKNYVEFLGHVSDEELVRLYGEAKAFLAMATDEDFGITPVESMLCGTPVIAYYGGGYKETVVDGKTGVFFHEDTPEGLMKAIKQFESMKIDPQDCKKQAEKFSKERFKKEIDSFVKSKVK